MEGGLLGFSFSLGSGYEIFLFIHKTDCVTCLLHCVLVYSLVFFITNAFRLLLAPFFFWFSSLSFITTLHFGTETRLRTFLSAA